MTKENKEGKLLLANWGLSALYLIGGLAMLWEVFRLGPIDLGRSVYNQIIGDTPVIKRQLVDYCRGAVIEDYSKEPKRIEKMEFLDLNIENSLATRLDVPLPYDGKTVGRINPNDVSIERLWDCVEEHPKSWYQRWVWPSLGQ